MRIQFAGLVILFTFLFLTACHKKDQNFETDMSGLKYQFLFKSMSVDTISPGDFIELELKYNTENDSVLFDSRELTRNFRMKVKEPTHKGGSFENAFYLSHPGDIISFILPADSFYQKTVNQDIPSGVEPMSILFFEMKIIKKLNPDEISKDRQVYYYQLEENEKQMITNYLHENNIKTEASLSGLYKMHLKEGSGSKAKTGDILIVHYIGKFLDGRVFDSSYSRNEPFSFQLGSGKVIEALEEACVNMKKGDRITIISPSVLAYGKEGYGKLIPPFSPLLFEIELISIN